MSKSTPKMDKKHAYDLVLINKDPNKFVYYDREFKKENVEPKISKAFIKRIVDSGVGLTPEFKTMAKKRVPEYRRKIEEAEPLGPRTPYDNKSTEGRVQKIFAEKGIEITEGKKVSFKSEGILPKPEPMIKVNNTIVANQQPSDAELDAARKDEEISRLSEIIKKQEEDARIIRDESIKLRSEQEQIMVPDVEEQEEVIDSIDSDIQRVVKQNLTTEGFLEELQEEKQDIQQEKKQDIQQEETDNGSQITETSVVSDKVSEISKSDPEKIKQLKSDFFEENITIEKYKKQALVILNDEMLDIIEKLGNEASKLYIKAIESGNEGPVKKQLVDKGVDDKLLDRLKEIYNLPKAPIEPISEAPIEPISDSVEPAEGIVGQESSTKPFATTGVESHPVKYHKNSVLFFFGTIVKPDWDLELESNIFAADMSKEEIVMRLDHLIGVYGDKMGVFKRMSDTKEELNEIMQMQFCLERMMSRGTRTKSALIPLKSLEQFANKLSNKRTVQPTDKQTTEDLGPEGQVPDEEQVQNVPAEQTQESVQIQLKPNEAKDKLAKAYHNSIYDPYGKPVINVDIKQVNEYKPVGAEIAPVNKQNPVDTYKPAFVLTTLDYE